MCHVRAHFWFVILPFWHWTSFGGCADSSAMAVNIWNEKDSYSSVGIDFITRIDQVDNVLMKRQWKGFQVRKEWIDGNEVLWPLRATEPLNIWTRSCSECLLQWITITHISLKLAWEGLGSSPRVSSRPTFPHHLQPRFEGESIPLLKAVKIGPASRGPCP